MFPIDRTRMQRILRRLEDYPEFRLMMHTPELSDVPVEHRYLAIIETLLNKFERVQTDLLYLQHPTTPKVPRGESQDLPSLPA